MSTLLCAFSSAIAGELNDRINRRAFPDVAWSSEQVPILDWFAKADQSAQPTLVVTARAGTGKTTVIMGGVARAPESRDSLTAKTIHALGFGFVRRFWSKISVDQRGRRKFDLAIEAAPKAPDDIIGLIANLHTKGREMAPLATSGDDLIDLAIRFDLEPPDELATYGWDLDAVCAAAYRAMELATERPRSNEIDFSDMLYLPIRNGWLRREYDLVVVDEAQDMNRAQIIIAREVCRGRLAVVGDDRQTIFIFRGAFSDVLDKIAGESNAVRLGLKTTYRCAKGIVKVARQYVPDFTAGESNPEGIVDGLAMDQLLDVVQPGDAILSRVNAPLVRLALRSLRNGVPAVMAGREDVATGIASRIKKLAKGDAAKCVTTFLEQLMWWAEREREKARRLPERLAASKVDHVDDTVECIYALADGVATVPELHSRLERIFSEVRAGRAVRLSSVHKAKGLEWARVFVLEQTLRAGHNIEEDNIAYVAVTRARQHLTMVR